MENSEGASPQVQTSEGIALLIQAELKIQEGIRDHVAEANRAIEAAEATLKRVSYDAEVKGDAAAIKAQADAQSKLSAAQNAVKQKNYALGTSEEILAGLRLKHKGAVADEDWLKIMADLQAMIDNDAPEIDRHFVESKKPAKPLVPVVEEHFERLQRWEERVRRHCWCPDMADLFWVYLYRRLSPLLQNLVGFRGAYRNEAMKVNLRGETWKQNLQVLYDESAVERANTLHRADYQNRQAKQAGGAVAAGA